MSEFINSLKAAGSISFTKMREMALYHLNRLSKAEITKIHLELGRGKNILDDEIHLNMYLRSYGKMHKTKLDEAFASAKSMLSLDGSQVEIYDWGCGQGTASICFLDYLLKSKTNLKIERITLVEPSNAAIKRAKGVISLHDYPVSSIRCVTKEFNDLESKDISSKFVHKIHLFSNILDVEFFDLSQFINLFQRSIAGDNHFICVGPYYTNNNRVDDFIAAVSPDKIFASTNLDRGQWIEDWTISLRVFNKFISNVETVDTIQRRITEAHKTKQFYAGYILDSVSEELSAYDKDITESLLKSISSFDVTSNKPLEVQDIIDSKWAVINNIITRGTPTIAPIELENIFNRCYSNSVMPSHDSPSIKYRSNSTLDSKNLYEALHIIDPRFNIENYNGDMIGSEFERSFIEKKLPEEDSEYIVQLLEPQRPLSSLVKLPDQKFAHERRVDFALEIPYQKEDSNNCLGFIVEIDGHPYHSNLFAKLNDLKRDTATSNKGWDTYRLNELSDASFVSHWESDSLFSSYLGIMKKNYAKTISGDWKKHLEILLSPFAVARVQKVIIEAIMSGALKMDASEWNISIIERDVPCGIMAIADLRKKFEYLALLDGSETQLPPINLDVVSTKEFQNSPLHLGEKVFDDQLETKYDICIDISILLRHNIDALSLSTEADTHYLVRSAHYKKGERTIYTAENITYLPLVDKNVHGEYVEREQPKEYLTYFLQDIFRKKSFRTGQLPILSRSLSNQTTIGLLPTGGGKSLTYQMSSVLQPGVTLVVDPLISLMVDQCRGLKDIRIDAVACVNSTMPRKDRERNLGLMQNGNLLFILLSPERFMMENFREQLYKMSDKNHVYFAYGVIDEVHCVSEWGHDFRPSYLHLGRNMIKYMSTKSNTPIPIIGLTATASFDVLADVERELTLGGNLSLRSDAIVRPENDTRPELTYKIVLVNANFDSIRDNKEPYLLIGNEWDIKDCVSEAKIRAIRGLFNKIPSELEAINDNPNCAIPNFVTSEFYSKDANGQYPNAGIIFCPHARGSLGVNDTSTKSGIAIKLESQDNERLSMGTFVGGANPTGDMQSFNSNLQNLMVATKAFGMGIDKPNVRYTINFNHPSSIESFVQEAGRAGRDKKNAISYLLFEPTEFIHLSIDKVNDIRALMGPDDDPIWLWNYREKYLLANDFKSLCIENECSKEQLNRILSICKEHGFYENVDKNVELWFHNNSFRGLYKEKVVLNEMTDRILNAKPKRYLKIQDKLRGELGNEDLTLKVLTNKNSLLIVSEEDPSKQYGYLFLDNLFATYKFINFDYGLCNQVMNTLIAILSAYPDHSSAWLNHAIDGAMIDEYGIYAAINDMQGDEYSYVTVSWENSIHQDIEEFERDINQAIQDIAVKQQWNLPNEHKYGKINLGKINDFDSLLSKISKNAEDIRWLTYHNHEAIYRPLKYAFCKKRDKDDTDKAIYRMCCIGLVEDVTIDYTSQTYKLLIKKRSEEEYLDFMLEFFKKYYSAEQAIEKVYEIKNARGRNIIDKCLSYLASFVYDNLEKKRYRAIEDMRLACEDGITKGKDWLKEFIHLYFNSKYARDDYKIDDKPYSLKMDTDKKEDDYSIVRKYVSAIRLDSSGSEVDNVKHLYGATLLTLRANPDHAVLHLLRTYCIAFLGTGSNESLEKDALDSFVKGFMKLNKSTNIGLMDLVDDYIHLLNPIVQDEHIKKEIIKKGRDLILLLKHADWFNQFAQKY